MAGAGEDLELLFHAEKTNLLSRNDALVLAVHSFLLDDGSKCVGKGEEWTDDEDVKGSKMLPHSWNDNQDKVSLRYTKGEKSIRTVLSVFADHDNTMMTIKDEALQKTEGICLDVGAYVNESYETFNGTYKNLEELRKRLKEEVLTPLTKFRQQEKERERAKEREKQQARMRHYDYEDDFLFTVPGASGYPPFGMSSRPSPFDYGRSDLDPFGSGRMGPGRMGPGGGGGGMLFEIPRPNRNPPIPGNFPRGSVPPGARFDPIGPFGPHTGMPRPRHPDPDVGLPPPGYDDMFN